MSAQITVRREGREGKVQVVVVDSKVLSGGTLNALELQVSLNLLGHAHRAGHLCSAKSRSFRQKREKAARQENGSYICGRATVSEEEGERGEKKGMDGS